jgi:hypothetical protein
VKVKAYQVSGRGNEAVAEVAAGIVDSADMPRPGTRAANNVVGAQADLGEDTCLRSFSRVGSGSQRGASSGEFAFAVLILAIAVVAGGLGGVWIAKREGLQKPKTPEPVQVASQPSDQSIKPPEAEKAPETPAPATPTGKPEAGARTASPGAIPLGPKHSSIEGISYSSQAGTTRVTIGMGSASLMRAALLPKPERVYFDLQGGEVRPDAKKSMTVTDDALLSGIRVARWKSGNTRIVLDLKRPCDFSYRLSPQPEPSLIVDLKPRSTVGTGSEFKKNN